MLHRTNVSEIMTDEVITITQDLKCDIAIELMNSNDISRLPVVGTGNRVIGIITLDQARLAMPKGSTFWGSSEEDEVPTVREAMTDFVYTIPPDGSIGRAATMMANHKIGALPVVKDKQLVGIVTESDLFRYLADQMPDGLDDEETDE